MRGLSLSRLLSGMTVGLVCLVVLCVVSAAVIRLRSLAHEQALARVSLAGASALQAVSRTGDELHTTSLHLAERPALLRFLAAGDSQGIGNFLEQFQRANHLSGCAVLREGMILAQSKSRLPWEDLAASQGEHAGRFLVFEDESRLLLLGANVPISDLPGTSVFVAQSLDHDYAQRIGEQVGMSVEILPLPTQQGESPAERMDRGRSEQAPREPRDQSEARREMQDALEERALDREAPVAERLDALDLYLTVLPLRSPSGKTVGLVEAGIPTSEIDAPLERLVRSLLLVSLGVACLAALSGVLVARWLARPLEALTLASGRIGHGDLSTPIPRAHGAEIGSLATTMEEMRGRLLHLTAELRRKQSEAEAIVTGIVEGVFAVDRERRIRFLNPQAAALLGIHAEEALGKFCGDVLNPQGVDGMRPCEESCPIVHARFRGSGRATEHLLLPGGVRRSVVITSAAATPSHLGTAAGTADPPHEVRQFQVVRDETDVEATRRIRDSVLANISHEFRTPLSAQLASIELLRDQLPELTTPEAERLILSLERGALRLMQLIDNLLESVRIEAGQDSIRHQSVALDEVVERASELAAPLIALRQQELVIDLPYPLPPLQGDSARLVQVLLNLLGNANKFAPPGSTIRIGGRVGETEISLWVEDEGPGLPDESDFTLFTPFVRSATEEPMEAGVGLGLWIVKSIVDRHGGRVEATSREGSGARMSVILPRNGGA